MTTDVNCTTSTHFFYFCTLVTACRLSWLLTSDEKSVIFGTALFSATAQKQHLPGNFVHRPRRRGSTEMFTKSETEIWNTHCRLTGTKTKSKSIIKKFSLFNFITQMAICLISFFCFLLTYVKCTIYHNDDNCKYISPPKSLIHLQHNIKCYFWHSSRRFSHSSKKQHSLGILFHGGVMRPGGVARVGVAWVGSRWPYIASGRPWYWSRDAAADGGGYLSRYRPYCGPGLSRRSARWVAWSRALWTPDNMAELRSRIWHHTTEKNSETTPNRVQRGSKFR